MHHLGRPKARQRAEILLEQFGLADAGDRLVKTWSDGMRRRLDVVASLITSPQVLFLDEPTTGLDPRSRAETMLSNVFVPTAGRRPAWLRAIADWNPVSALTAARYARA